MTGITGFRRGIRGKNAASRILYGAVRLPADVCGHLDSR